jgi:hypothetical protein
LCKRKAYKIRVKALTKDLLEFKKEWIKVTNLYCKNKFQFQGNILLNSNWKPEANNGKN